MKQSKIFNIFFQQFDLKNSPPYIFMYTKEIV